MQKKFIRGKLLLINGWNNKNNNNLRIEPTTNSEGEIEIKVFIGANEQKKFSNFFSTFLVKIHLNIMVIMHSIPLFSPIVISLLSSNKNNAPVSVTIYMELDVNAQDGK